MPIANVHPLRLPIGNQALRRLIENSLGLRQLARIYDAWLEQTHVPLVPIAEQFLDFVLGRLQTSLSWDGGVAPDLPSSGPLIVVANHPFGGIEGMLLARELLRIRPDTRVLTNELLLRIPEFRNVFIGVDVLSESVTRRNASGIRQACRHLGAAGTLLIFPAGTVSHFDLRSRSIKDPPWNDLVGRLALRYDAACLPVRLEGRNGIGFYLAGYLHKRLRTALLPRELLTKRRQVLRARAGELLTPKDIRSLADPGAVTACLRFAMDALAVPNPMNEKAKPLRTLTPLARDCAHDELVAQHQLLEEYRLLRSDEFEVYCAPYAELGCVMNQIAVERERTFRAVDEGTGRELDSDRFDSRYWHLWVWHREHGDIVGAYRIARSDLVVRNHGINSLYSRSLFRYDESFVGQVGPALEVGRSFVCLPYQRQPKALDLLWRGIGAFVLRNPGYHTLFGCVSVSSQYSTLARAFLADVLMESFSAGNDWSRRVRPIERLRARPNIWNSDLLESLNSVAIINKLLGNLDKGRRIPILLRHYIALNGRFVSFCVNQGFNDSLDGLIIVDLRNAPQRYLSRYMGTDGSRDFLARWTNYNEQAA